MSQSPDEAKGPPAGIRAAREQFEAARSRQQRLAASGHLVHTDTNGSPGPLKVLPGYTLLRELHRGGQGVVHLAVQNSTGRQVAIKVLKRDWPHTTDAAGLARFEREIEILSSLKHPNVVTIHDCGRDRGQVYLVMDFVDGRPLDVWVERDRAPLAETLDVFARICDGVNAAHLRGVIHRDLKPGNILVDPRGEPHVVDFGLAKFDERSHDDATREPSMTETGQFVGSLPWASPEQAQGRTDALDIRSDVYSLGVLMYQVLTGRFPYPVKGRHHEIVGHIVATSPTPPSAIEGRIDRELETILLKCLAKEPVRRYQNAGELARDIRHYLAGEAIEARRDSLAYVMGKRLARYRAAVLATVAMLGVVLAALIVSITFWRAAVRQATLAQQNAASAQDYAARADREAEQARAVSGFLHEIITSVEPEHQGADVRLIEVIREASALASGRFQGHAQHEAGVRDLLGQVFDSLSMWAEAEREFRRAGECWEQAAGPDDPRTLEVRARHVQELLNLERTNQAAAALEDLMPRLLAVHGPGHPRTLATLRDVAMLELQQGRVDDAERRLMELRQRPELAGDDGPGDGGAGDGGGAGDDAAQIRILIGLIGVQTSRLGAAEAGAVRGALVEAQSLAREWMERSMRLHGPDAVMTLQARVRWADFTCSLGQVQEAAATCREILALPAGRLGDCHVIRSSAMYVLADALTALGEAGEAADLHMQRLACVRGQLPGGSPAMLGALYDVLRYLERAGRAAEGEALARELEAALAGVGGGHDNMQFAAQLFVAQFVSMQGRLEEAGAMLESLAARERELGEDARTRARLHVYLGWHRLRAGALEQAEAEFTRAAEALGDIRMGTWDVFPDDVALGFVALYEAWHKPEQAREYARLRDEIRASRLSGSE